MSKKIEGFSKLSKTEKINWITQMHFEDVQNAKEIISTYNHSDEMVQKLHDEFIENSIANFYLPMGVAPNFLINGTVSNNQVGTNGDAFLVLITEWPEVVVV